MMPVAKGLPEALQALWEHPLSKTRHLAIDADTHEILAVELTVDDVGGVSMIPDLLDQIDGPVGLMTADGAYNGQVVYDGVTQRHPEAKVIIPPRSTAVPSEAPTSQCDQHVQAIAERGRISWQRSSG